MARFKNSPFAALAFLLSTGLLANPSDGGCFVNYQIKDQWGEGFVAEVTLTNSTTRDLDGWKVSFHFNDGQRVNNFWSSHVQSNANFVTMSNVDWNSRVEAGKSVVFGFQGSHLGVNTTPAAFAITADGCESAGGEPLPPVPPSPPDESTPNPEPKPPVPPPPPSPPAPPVEGVNDDDWLHTDGHKIVDKAGQPVWLTGTNWFGFNTGTNAFDGLWAVNLEDSVQAIAVKGFNILRIPVSTEIVDAWRRGIYPAPRSINNSVNSEIVGKDSLQIFELVLQLSRKYGLKILIDIHSPLSESMGHMDPLWYKGSMDSERFYTAWEWLAERYKNNDTVVAFDLKNEPHGKPYQQEEAAIWDDSQKRNNWRYAAEQAALRILKIHPRVLILVEGIEASPRPSYDYSSKDEKAYYHNWWGGNLRQAREYPVDLGEHSAQLVYSPHDYGPLVYKQPWFYPGFDRETLYRDVWQENWAYLMEENIAPILIGEWGGFLDGGDNQKWMVALRDYMKDNYIHHTFWCFNANSGDTGGLVLNDFKTWDETKYNLVKPVLWQDSRGRFIGLDHEVPLGSLATGSTVKAYYEALEPMPSN